MAQVFYLNPQRYGSPALAFDEAQFVFTDDVIGPGKLNPRRWIRENLYEKTRYYVQDSHGYVSARDTLTGENIRETYNWAPEQGFEKLTNWLFLHEKLERKKCVIFLHSLPLMHTPTVAKDQLMRDVDELRTTFPKATFVAVHSTFSVAFWRWKAPCGGLFDPAKVAGPGEVLLPSGLVASLLDQSWSKWSAKFGFTSRTIRTETHRVLFNSLSILYAAKKIPSPTVKTKPKRGSLPLTLASQVAASGADKVYCDSCSLAPSCLLAREGEVCSVPDSDGESLKDLFGSSKSSDIILGLGRLGTINAERLEKALKIETDADAGPSDEVTKLIDKVFSQGVTYAKLLDPSLRSSPKVNVGVNIGNMPSEEQLTGTPRQQMATVRRMMIESGFRADQINDTTIQAFLMTMQDDGAALEIEGSVAENALEEHPF